MAVDSAASGLGVSLPDENRDRDWDKDGLDFARKILQSSTNSTSTAGRTTTMNDKTLQEDSGRLLSASSRASSIASLTSVDSFSSSSSSLGNHLEPRSSSPPLYPLRQSNGQAFAGNMQITTSNSTKLFGNSSSARRSEEKAALARLVNMYENMASLFH